MCLGSKGVTTISNPQTPNISTWTPDQINQFLVKYPTLSKAQAASPFDKLTAGYDPTSIWQSVAGSKQGRDFLAVHAANRRAAGDTTEADQIAAFLKGSDPTTLTRLPTLPPPAPSDAASGVASADIVAANKSGTNPLLIPLASNKPTLPLL